MPEAEADSCQHQALTPSPPQPSRAVSPGILQCRQTDQLATQCSSLLCARSAPLTARRPYQTGKSALSQQADRLVPVFGSCPDCAIAIRSAETRLAGFDCHHCGQAHATHLPVLQRLIAGQTDLSPNQEQSLTGFCADHVILCQRRRSHRQYAARHQ